MSPLFDPRIFDPRIFDTGPVVSPETIFGVDYRLVLQMQLAPPDWTDVSDDWGPGSEPLRFFRGTRSGGPTDVIVETGIMTFVMRNDEDNSAKRAGYYSTNHPFVRHGFKMGTPVRLLVVYGEIVKPLWTGKIQVIDPDSGQYGNRRTYVTAHDTMGELATSEISSIPPQINKTENQLIITVLTTADPTADYNLDVPIDTFPYALHDIGGGLNTRTALYRIALSSQLFAYIDGNGALRSKSRISQALESPGFHFDNTMTSLEQPTSLEQVFNDISVSIKPPTPGPAVVILYTHPSKTLIQPGETIEGFGNYSDQTNPDKLLGGIDFIDPPEAGVDYSANSLENGTGNNHTADLVVNYDFFAGSFKYTITNEAAVPVYVTIKARGRPVTEPAAIIKRASLPQDYGVRHKNIELIYQANQEIAEEFARNVAASYGPLRNQVQSIEFIPEDDGQLEGALVKAVIDQELGGVVQVTENQTGLVLANAYVQGMEVTVVEGQFRNAIFYTKPRTVTDEMNADEIICSDVLDFEVVVPEDRIGEAIVGFSEVGIP
jgi:hypothetical protein